MQSQPEHIQQTRTVQPEASKVSGIEVYGRIITEDTLIAANAERQSIRISSGAVMTPSARDYIRRNQIDVSNSKLAQPTALNGVAIVSTSSTTLQAALKTAEWPVVSATTDFHAATEVVTTENTMMLCSVQQPSVAACLLNRSHRFRAAVVHPSDDFTALQTTMHPNVICLSPTGWSIAGFMTLLKELSVGTNRPSLWKEIRS